jgi:ribosomal protein S18 acetylase RimI-like enzyme
MSIHLKEANSLGELKQFIRFPFELYRGNQYWIPPLISEELDTLRRDKNPAFEVSSAKYWLALDGKRVVGRIAGIINSLHIKKWDQSIARFGWIDFIDDSTVSAMLLGAVEDWARQEGMQAVHGPLGFSNMDHAGMLIEGFEELPTQATIYNYPYYSRHMELAGYEKDIDWLEYELPIPESIDEKFIKLADKVRARYKLRLVKPGTKKELLLYARQLFDMLVEEYKHLYAAVPLTEKQIEAYTERYIGVIPVNFVPIIVDEAGEMVAFGITMPSLSKAMQRARGHLFPLGIFHVMRALKYNDRVDLMLVAIKKEYQGRGLNAILITEMFKIFRNAGIRYAESNPELENNIAVQAQWRHFERRQHKRRRAYIKRITG